MKALFDSVCSLQHGVKEGNDDPTKQGFSAFSGTEQTPKKFMNNIGTNTVQSIV